MPAEVPELVGVLTRSQVAATAAALAAMQTPAGAIGWPDGHVDAWDHVECAMALSVGGQAAAASRAFRWLVDRQRPDGSWPASSTDHAVLDPMADTNQCAYVAVGTWHQHLHTGDRRFVETMWPVVRRALDFVTALQAPTGEIWWACRTDDSPGRAALLTGCSSTYQSLRCGLALAELVGEAQPEWELAAGRLRHALAYHPELFEDKARFSMDWYYPVLGGVLRGSPGRARLASRWAEFVVPGLGVRCVADQPWVTGAETCELALALDAVDDRVRAREVLTSMQHLRHDDGSYWTGYVYPDQVRWPSERSSWTAAALILAVDALARSSATSGLFRATELPTGIVLGADSCADEGALCASAAP